MTSVSGPSDSNRDAAEAKGSGPVARPQDVLRYGKTYALGGSYHVPSACMVGLIGPDGIGKWSLLAFISGAGVIRPARAQEHPPRSRRCRSSDCC